MRIHPARMTALAGICLLTSFVLARSLCCAAEPVKATATQMPREVLIIRHGEKPAVEASSVDLSPEGFLRAAAIPQLFQASDRRPKPFPTPDFIFAAKNSKHSHRSFETVTPLARKLNLTINTDYANENFGVLVRHIFEHPKYAGKTILIAWHHGNIPALARELKAAAVPETWHGSVFDRVWQITYDDKGAITFRNRPQQLLPKDMEK